MSELTQDILMYLILLIAWFFGVSAMLHDNHRVSYKEALVGWLSLNAMIIAVASIVGSIFWAVDRLAT
tara:strand:- start:24 stop:227 length:204 start_codon:yes stop_codon:yes gene_type:complete